MTSKPTTSISQLTFSGGNSFQFNANEKVILVGPNNSGKSQSLREIINICKDGNTEHSVVVKGLNLSKNGTSSGLKDFFKKEGDFSGAYYSYKSWQLHESHINLWDNEYLVGDLWSGFIKNIAANERLTVCEQQQSISRGTKI